MIKQAASSDGTGERLPNGLPAEFAHAHMTGNLIQGTFADAPHWAEPDPNWAGSEQQTINICIDHPELGVRVLGVLTWGGDVDLAHPPQAAPSAESTSTTPDESNRPTTASTTGDSRKLCYTPDLMKVSIMPYDLTEWQLDQPADADIVDRLNFDLGVLFPIDYLDFLRKHDGGEGFIGDNYVILWRAEELGDFNREYEVEKYAPGIFMFGSNGGGEGYGFDTHSAAMPIVRVPFIGMDRRYATPIAKDLADLFAKLAIHDE